MQQRERPAAPKAASTAAPAKVAFLAPAAGPVRAAAGARTVTENDTQDRARLAFSLAETKVKKEKEPKMGMHALFPLPLVNLHRCVRASWQISTTITSLSRMTTICWYEHARSL